MTARGRRSRGISSLFPVDRARRPGHRRKKTRGVSGPPSKPPRPERERGDCYSLPPMDPVSNPKRIWSEERRGEGKRGEASRSEVSAQPQPGSVNTPRPPPSSSSGSMRKKLGLCTHSSERSECRDEHGGEHRSSSDTSSGSSRSSGLRTSERERGKWKGRGRRD